VENVIDVLRERGFIQDETSEDLRRIVSAPLKVYCGFDPTADSLQLGNLVGIMGLAWFQRCGHTPVAIVGGATGMIGDPSGKTSERQLLTPEIIEKNLMGIRKNLEKILNQGSTPPVILNNFEWFKQFSFIDFLRDVGKFFRLGPMLAKDSVKARLHSEEGMSYTEFSYQLLQGFDFLHLYQNHRVQLQIGGSDQWGNITAGVELVRKVLGESVYGLTFPLLVKSDGQKFGKSESGTIWLSPEKLSPYEFYQYLVRVSDADVIQCLKMLTFLPMSEITACEKELKEPGCPPNKVQKILAAEVTRIVHGEEALQAALKVTAFARPGSSDTVLDAQSLELISKDMPSLDLAVDEILGRKLIDLIVAAKMLPSKTEARKMLKNGGVYLNNIKIDDELRELGDSDLLGGHLFLIAIGKKNKILVKVGKPLA
jgi:tyrosyl-tRNA synthetase